MSQTYITAIIGILTVILPVFGVQLESAELTNGIQSVVAGVAFVWILVRRVQMGDISVLGARKYKTVND